MIIGWTGHRPNEFTDEQKNKVIRAISESFDERKPERVIVGGALGVDTWAALVAINKGVPFTLALPFDGHHLIWPEKQQDIFLEIKSFAAEVVVVCEGGWDSKRDNWKFQKRNEYIVNHCDFLIGVWNGSSGGTANCMRYGIRVDKEMQWIDPRRL